MEAVAMLHTLIHCTDVPPVYGVLAPTIPRATSYLVFPSGAASLYRKIRSWTDNVVHWLLQLRRGSQRHYRSTYLQIVGGGVLVLSIATIFRSVPHNADAERSAGCAVLETCLESLLDAVV